MSTKERLPLDTWQATAHGAVGESRTWTTDRMTWFNDLSELAQYDDGCGADELRRHVARSCLLLDSDAYWILNGIF